VPACRGGGCGDQCCSYITGWVQRFAASTGFYRPKQEAIRQMRMRFLDPTGLRRITLPYIACLESRWQLGDEGNSIHEPESQGGEDSGSADPGPEGSTTAQL
jgi:hypothetical protein